jgi:predicted chitinase
MSLSNITEGINIGSLVTIQVKELQMLLNQHGYNLIVDGIAGQKTKQALASFKKDNFLAYPEFVGKSTVETLKEKKSQVKNNNNYDFSTKEGTVKAIIKECKKQGLSLKNQIAYVLATVEWETANTFKPVNEAFWMSEEWKRKNLRYWPYIGKGFVQLTWKANYQKYSQILGLDLVNNPDKVLEPNVSLFILVHGCKNGTFTGMKIEDYIDNNKTDFYNARRVINGIDKAQEIAVIARQWAKKQLITETLSA